jgi:hypothetical protein
MYTHQKNLVLACMAAITIVVLASLTPGHAHAGEQGSPEPGVPLPESGDALVDDNASGATQARQKAQESVNALSGDIQELKKSVIALNKDLRVLEEDLLFPANTQLNVFLSLDVGDFFRLESVKLKLDGEVVANHIYSETERNALAQSGIHRLHIANLSVGKHSISAFFTGMGPNGREYKRGTSLEVNKQNGPKYVELKITDSTKKLQPEFSVQEW